MMPGTPEPLVTVAIPSCNQGRYIAETIGKCLGGWSQPARILFGRDRANAKRLGPVQQTPDIPDNSLVVRDQRNQLLLNVNDQQRGIRP